MGNLLCPFIPWRNFCVPSLTVTSGKYQSVRLRRGFGLALRPNSESLIWALRAVALAERRPRTRPNKRISIQVFINWPEYVKWNIERNFSLLNEIIDFSCLTIVTVDHHLWNDVNVLHHFINALRALALTLVNTGKTGMVNIGKYGAIQIPQFSYIVWELLPSIQKHLTCIHWRVILITECSILKTRWWLEVHIISYFVCIKLQVSTNGESLCSCEKWA